MSLGRTILSFCPVIPHGLLVFFTSYSVLYKCRDTWQASGIWSQIQRHKPIYIEPKTKDEFTNTMTDYYAKINDPVTKGAIFMAVCRGKVSEGLDFADNNGRAVFITGLPFPPYMDPRIILKKKYLQDNRTVANQVIASGLARGCARIAIFFYKCISLNCRTVFRCCPAMNGIFWKLHELLTKLLVVLSGIETITAQYCCAICDSTINDKSHSYRHGFKFI